MNKASVFLKFLISACMILLAALLVFGCLSHVILHDGAKNMYSFASVKAHFALFKWAYIGLLGYVFLFSTIAVFLKKPSKRFQRAMEYRRGKNASSRLKTCTRVFVFALSAILIVLGIANGGLYDVFVKAVNICTECIGLG
ncbi:MAG: hypothetical protein E7322_00050 [Clostridiales bacterium]|nr:hypothetical protein [Clostridiales bacterium]